jgi:hypothetical protein
LQTAKHPCCEEQIITGKKETEEKTGFGKHNQGDQGKSAFCYDIIRVEKQLKIGPEFLHAAKGMPKRTDTERPCCRSKG